MPSLRRVALLFGKLSYLKRQQRPQVDIFLREKWMELKRWFGLASNQDCGRVHRTFFASNFRSEWEIWKSRILQLERAELCTRLGISLINPNLLCNLEFHMKSRHVSTERLLTIVRLIKTHILTIDKVSFVIVIILDQKRWFPSYSSNFLKILHYFERIFAAK